MGSRGRVLGVGRGRPSGRQIRSCQGVRSRFSRGFSVLGISKAPGDLKESLLLAWRAFEERFPSIGLTSAGAVLYGELKSRYQEHTGASSRKMKTSTVDF